MKNKLISSIAAGFAALLTLTCTAQAADKKDLSNENMQEQMMKAQELTTPSAEHTVLNVFEGKWAVTSRHWMKRGEKAESSSGTSEMNWVLDGHFLKQKFKGDWAGKAFEGIGFLGYDKVKKEYVSVWMDNISTGIFQASGQYDPISKTIENGGNFSCPITGKTMSFRSNWKILNENHLIYSMFMEDPNGKEFKSMEITYKRVK